MNVTKQLRTETGHRLTNYDGRCSHLHGHSYLWEVTATCADTQMDDKNMVMDFKDLKKAMNEVLDPLDHALVLGKDDPLWALAAASGGPLSDILRATNGKEPRLFEWPDNPTAESFAVWALEAIQYALLHSWEMSVAAEHGHVDEHTQRMPYFISAVKVWETATSYAEAKAGNG